MMTICGPQIATIKFTDTIVCGKLIRITNIQSANSDLVDIMIEGEMQKAYMSGSALRRGAEIWTLYLISKNVPGVTADIKLTVSQDPCIDVPCPDICIDNNLWSQRCQINYDTNLLPISTTCIKGTLKQSGSPACQATHFLDIVITPWSWYTPGGAVIEIIKKTTDINGALANLFAGITGWNYLGIDVLTQGEWVVVRTYLKELSVTETTGGSEVYAMIAPAALTILLEQIASIVIIVSAIIVVIGIIVGIYLVTSSLQSVFGKDFTKSEVGDNAVDTIAKAEADCKKNFLPKDPVGYANCMKSGITAITAGLGDLYNDSDITNAGKTAGAGIDKCSAQYNIDKDAQKLEFCVKASVEPVKTKIAQKTAARSGWVDALIIGTVIAGVLGVVYFATRKPNETKIFIERAAEAVKAPLIRITEPRVPAPRAIPVKGV